MSKFVPPPNRPSDAQRDERHVPARRRRRRSPLSVVRADRARRRACRGSSRAARRRRRPDPRRWRRCRRRRASATVLEMKSKSTRSSWPGDRDGRTATPVSITATFDARAPGGEVPGRGQVDQRVVPLEPEERIVRRRLRAPDVVRLGDRDVGAPRQRLQRESVSSFSRSLGARAARSARRSASRAGSAPRRLRAWRSRAPLASRAAGTASRGPRRRRAPACRSSPRTRPPAAAGPAPSRAGSARA